MALKRPELTRLAGESELLRTEPLFLGGLRALVFEVLDRERVAALPASDAGAALPGDHLSVLASTDAQRNHPAPQRVRRRTDDVACARPARTTVALSR